LALDGSGTRPGWAGRRDQWCTAPRSHSGKKTRPRKADPIFAYRQCERGFGGNKLGEPARRFRKHEQRHPNSSFSAPHISRQRKRDEAPPAFVKKRRMGWELELYGLNGLRVSPGDELPGNVGREHPTNFCSALFPHVGVSTISPRFDHLVLDHWGDAGQPDCPNGLARRLTLEGFSVWWAATS